jgi:hypothetical protein
VRAIGAELRYAIEWGRRRYSKFGPRKDNHQSWIQANFGERKIFPRQFSAT